MQNKNKYSCINEFDPSALDEVKAIARITKSIKQIDKSEKVNIKQSFGRVCFENIKSKISIPSFRNSAMDGYAVNISQLKKNNYILKQTGISLAGKPYIKKLKEKETIRVMTGSLIPQNCDAVIMKEMVQIRKSSITFPDTIKKNQNIRFIGEDIKKNNLIIKKGKVIDYIDLGILSSIGISTVKVFAKPIVSFFSTGDELVSITKRLRKGEIYDSNRYLLFGLLSKLPVIIKDMGVVRDNELAISNKLKECSKISDVIITTGGVSVGDADFIKSALKKVGEINFWKISIKPGRPLAFGKINKAKFFGLPGNPVSAAITFQLFVIPAIEKMLSSRKHKKLIIKAKLVTNLTKKKGRIEYKRAILTHDNGDYIVNTTGLQGSNILTSLASANCYIRLSAETDKVKKGDYVDTLPFDIEI